MEDKRDDALPYTTAYLEGQRKLREAWRQRDEQKIRVLTRTISTHSAVWATRTD